MNQTVSARIGVKPTSHFKIDLLGRDTYANYDIDNFGGVGGDDPNSKGLSNETDLSAQAALDSWQGRLVQKASASMALQTRRFVNPTDAQHPADSSQSSSYGRTAKFSYQAVGQLHETDTLTAGVDQQEETARSDSSSQSGFGPFSSSFDYRSAHTTGVFVEDLVKLYRRFFVSVGGRLDDHSQFGTALTYRIAPMLLIPETRTKLKASVGTGFKAPSLYQFYSQFGTTTLLPERSSGWDAGFEQEFDGGAAMVGATYFRDDLRDLIEFNDVTNVYFNVNRARTEGYEVTGQVRPFREIAFKSNFTYTSAVSLTDGSELLRRPRIKFGGDVEVRPIPGASFLLGAIYTGPRVDDDFSTFPANRVTLGGYALWHFTASYAVNPHLKLTGRIDNMFDKRYEEVEGFGTMGTAGYGGLEIDF